MGKPQRRRKTTAKNKRFRRMMKMRNTTMFDDQIYENLQPEKAQKIKEREADVTLPGLGQFYCITCNIYFVNEKALIQHLKTKSHKRRAKKLKEKPYDHKEAELLNR